MKHLFILLLYIACCIPAYSGTSEVPDDTEDKKITKREIIISRTLKTPILHRSLPGDIEALVDYSTDAIELSMYGLGETSVYIVDSDNQEVDFCTVDGDTCQSFLIGLPPVAGHYWLVIDSELLYAEGEFTVE